ncbi:hypothetical protein Q3O60_08720 [Alkalimonas collagenimarina]|uniref:Secreted protein n=1 Tax=Alkalimonas collagenimarina TaxID=400390 RepID=A0ABT9GYX6_9GAMM|nr:hypothetical protein [Alkalimonas collagenimarina]MDP4536269.1 hypothetical protein [Alkalimonas collagenimarina]
MITKTIFAATVVLCATAFQPSAEANDINMSQLMTELLQKQAIELQEQIKQNSRDWILQMTQQAAQSIPHTAEVDVKSAAKADVELVVAKKQHDELGE